MNFPIIIQDGEIIFSYSPMKINGLRSYYTILSWMTDYGMVIPFNHISIGIKFGLIESKLDIESDYTIAKALLLDIDGFIKEITVFSNEKNIKVVTIPVECSEGTKYVRSESIEHEECITALFSLNYSNDEVLEFLDKNSIINNTSVCRYKIADLQLLVEKHCINPKKYHSSVLTNS